MKDRSKTLMGKCDLCNKRATKGYRRAGQTERHKRCADCYEREFPKEEKTMTESELIATAVSTVQILADKYHSGTLDEGSKKAYEAAVKLIENRLSKANP